MHSSCSADGCSSPVSSIATVPKPLQPRMASKRLAASTVNWAEFASKIPEAQRASFNALKNKTDGYVRKIANLPESQPKIDWGSYKARIAVPGAYVGRGWSVARAELRFKMLAL